MLVFPGSNCDHDAYHVAAEVLGEQATMLWHESTDLQGCDAIMWCRAGLRMGITCGRERLRSLHRSCSR